VYNSLPNFPLQKPRKRLNPKVIPWLLRSNFYLWHSFRLLCSLLSATVPQLPLLNLSPRDIFATWVYNATEGREGEGTTKVRDGGALYQWELLQGVKVWLVLELKPKYARLTYSTCETDQCSLLSSKGRASSAVKTCVSSLAGMGSVVEGVESQENAILFLGHTRHKWEKAWRSQVVPWLIDWSWLTLRKEIPSNDVDEVDELRQPKKKNQCLLAVRR